MKLISMITKEMERFFSKNFALVRLYNMYYKNIVKREVELAEINCNDCVLCIGGGSVPCTALEIAAKTGARVRVIDVDPDAIEKSKKIILKLNLSHCVKAQLISGQNINASDFSVIHIARQAVPHNEIIENITKNASTNTRILLRSNKNCLKKLNKIFDKGICGSQMKQGIFSLKSTILFTIKPRRSESEEVSSYNDSYKSSVVNTMVG
ncbi:UNVERIFIED_CONTAM: Dimethyladenosine transferase (rRNA methylation) [Acetivibrio alkalicellulosi]